RRVLAGPARKRLLAVKGRPRLPEQLLHVVARDAAIARADARIQALRLSEISRRDVPVTALYDRERPERDVRLGEQLVLRRPEPDPEPLRLVERLPGRRELLRRDRAQRRFVPALDRLCRPV